MYLLLPLDIHFVIYIYPPRCYQMTYPKWDISFAPVSMADSPLFI